MDLGQPFVHEGILVREVLNDFSHLHELNRPPKYIVADVEKNPRPQHWSKDKSEDRQPIPMKYAGKPIRELKGKHSGRVAILFNGWSLKGKDLHSIRAAGIPLIGMNRTHEGFPGYDGPQPEYLCVVDFSWLDSRKVTSHPGLINGSTDKRELGYRIARSFRMDPVSFDLDRDGYVPPVPCTTGALALQLAPYLGFTELFCLGLDMCGQHFDETQGSLHFNYARGQLTRMAQAFEGAGIKVVVCGSPDSKAPFEKVPFEELFA